MTHTVLAAISFDDIDSVRPNNVTGSLSFGTPPAPHFGGSDLVSARSADTGAWTFGTNIDSAGHWDLATTNVIWIAIHVYIETLPSAGNFHYLFRGGTSAQPTDMEVRLTSAGIVQIWNRTATTWVDSPVALTTNKHYVLSIRHDGAAAMQVRARDWNAAGTLLFDFTHPGGTVLNPTRFSIGSLTASYGTCHFDNLVIEAAGSGANIDDPVNLITPFYYVRTLLPTANGDENGWTNDWTYTDEIPHDGDTTSRVDGGNGTTFLEHLQDLASLAIPVRSVPAICFVLVARSTGTEQVSLRVKSGTTVTNYNSGNEPASYTVKMKTLAADPDGGPWTLPRVDAVQLGASRDDITNQARVTAVRADAIFTLAPGGQQLADVIG